MMGERTVMQEALFYSFSIEEHVPADHLLRSIDRFVDLGEIREYMRSYYSDTGRPSIDPELMIRMLIIGYLRDVVIAGRYIDRYEKREGIWKFAYRSEVVDWARDDPATDAFMEGTGNIWSERKPDDRLYNRSAMTRPESGKCN